MKTQLDSKTPNSSSKPPRKVILALVAFLALGAVAIGAVAKNALQADRSMEQQNYLRRVAMAAVFYADDNRHYPYVDGDWEQTIDLLHEQGYLEKEAPEGMTFEGFKAPYSRSHRGTIVVAWGELETDREGREVRTIVGSNCVVVTVAESKFQEIKAQHDRYAREVVSTSKRSRSGS